VSSIYILVIVFVVAALVALALVWLYARNVKRDLDESPGDIAGKHASLTMTPGSIQKLRELSGEPILLKQSEDGVRVQIEHRPMLPLMAFVGRDVSAALNEAAALVSEKWGPRWVVLLSARDDGQVTVQRLS